MYVKQRIARHVACRGLKRNKGRRRWLLKFGSFLPFRLSHLRKKISLGPDTSEFTQSLLCLANGIVGYAQGLLIYCFAPLFVVRLMGSITQFWLNLKFALFVFPTRLHDRSSSVQNPWEFGLPHFYSTPHTPLRRANM